jgi:hypothetical protein
VEDWSEEEDGDVDGLIELCWKDLTGIIVNMMLEDNPNDLDWVPEKLKNKAAKQKEKAKVSFKELELSNTPNFYAGEWPKQYEKGFDVMSKSKRTQECSRKQNKDQTSLTSCFVFTSQAQHLHPQLTTQSCTH